MSDGDSLRQREAEKPSRWWIFLILSLGLHFVVFHEAEWMRRAMAKWSESLPSWARSALEAPSPLADAPDEKPKPAEEETDVEMNLSFVEVDPLAVTQDAPEKTPLYSTVNSLAGNPEMPEKPSDKPKFDGQQEVMIRTFDNPRPPEMPLLKPDPSPGPLVPEPAAPAVPVTQVLPEVDRSKPVEPLLAPIPIQPKPEPKVEKKPEVKVEPRPVPTPPAELPPKAEVAKAPQEKPQTPEAGPKPGDLAMARPSPRAVVEAPTPTPAQPLPVTPALTVGPTEVAPAEAPRPRRPRTLSQARAQKGILAGEKMKQEGGVSRLSIVPSLDVKASPFGSYDGHMIFAIQQRWYRLLDDNHYALERVGKVVVRFVLNSDGTITQLRRVHTEVGETLGFICEGAIIEPAPYEPWPAEMRKAVGSDTRELTFTFFYN